MISKVVRVATTNNFNCTAAEWRQLDQIAKDNPDKVFFVNSNINTPRLNTIKKHPYKAVVTLNPDLIPQPAALIKALCLDKKKIAFFRIKWLPDNDDIMFLLERMILEGIPVVVTLQRFNGLKTLNKFTTRDHYTYDCSRFRLAGHDLKFIESFVDIHQVAGRQVYICDRKGLGCQGCGLCSRLATDEDHEIVSLNLSSSGICPFNCPDCYAKTMQKFVVSMGHPPIKFDKIMKNHKQKGKTAHIKRSLAHVPRL